MNKQSIILMFIGVISTSFIGYTLYMNQFDTGATWQWLQNAGSAVQTQLGNAWNNVKTTLTDNPQNLLTGAVAASAAIIPVAASVYNSYKQRAQTQLLSQQSAIDNLKNDAKVYDTVVQGQLETLQTKVNEYEATLSQTPQELLEAQQLVSTQQTEITKLRQQIEDLHTLIKGFTLKDDETIVKTVVK